MRIATSATREAVKAGKLKEFELKERNGLLVLGTRANLAVKHHYGKDSLPVIMSSTRVAELIMMDAHSKDHRSVAITVAISRKTCFIVGARKLAKTIVKSCVKCRVVAKKLQVQKMGSLPERLQVPAPCFTNISVDLAGPFYIKDMVVTKNTRRVNTYRKMWVSIYVCLNTKAVKFYFIPGYSAEDFLFGWEQHVSDCGKPSTVYSDMGTNIASAAKDVTEEIDFQLIARSTGVTWFFAPPAAQFRNGTCEAYVKKMKHTLMVQYGEAKMNVVEMLTALKRIGYIINSCPIAARDKRGLISGALGSGQTGSSLEPDFLEPITPNDLLLGRSGKDPIEKDYELFTGPRKRLAFMKKMEEDWWERYKLECFECLLPREKWRNTSTNLEEGDIVLIKYEGKSKPGDYRWGVVTQTEPDDDECVRTVFVRYGLFRKAGSSGQNLGNGDENYSVTFKEIRVAVQRLCLIYSRKEQLQDTEPNIISGCDKSDKLKTLPKRENASGMVNSLLFSCHYIEEHL